MPEVNLQPLPAEEIGTYTNSTKVLISFGAAQGGFEFALVLRHEIYRANKKDPSKEPAFVYIDAITLAKAEGTRYDQIEGADIYKMQNPHWFEFYPAAMARCSTMIFLLTHNWLISPFCWEELGWFREQLKKSMIRPIFVVFRDALDDLKKQQIVARDDKTYRPATMWEEMKAVPRAVVVNVVTEADASLRSVEVIKNEGLANQQKLSNLEFHYACNEGELGQILAAIVL